MEVRFGVRTFGKGKKEREREGKKEGARWLSGS